MDRQDEEARMIKRVETVLREAEEKTAREGTSDTFAGDTIERLFSLLNDEADEMTKDLTFKERTFDEAFAEARRLGLETFIWKGKPYHTRRDDEPQK
jgi:hypothetical protein